MKIHTPLITTFLALALAATGRAQTPLVEYLFNETGASASSSAGAASTLTLRNSTNTKTDLHSADGSGVSGNAGDRAFDNTGSTGMGRNFSGGHARGTESLSVSSLSAFTLTGWFKTDSGETVGNTTYLLSYYDFGTSTGFSLTSSTAGILTLTVNGTTYQSSGSKNFGTTGQWTYFAVSYDASSVKFYVGTDNSAQTTIMQDANREVPSYSVVNTSGKVLTLGNTSSVGDQRPFDGLMDNIRIFDTSLSKTQIESIRTEDLTFSTIPEPSSFALILGILVLALPAMRRFRRR